MRLATVITTAAIYFAATHAIPIPDEPKGPPPSPPLIQNLEIPAINAGSVVSGLSNGGAGAAPDQGGAVGKIAVIARRKKRGEKPAPPGAVGGVLGKVTGGAGGATGPVSGKVDPSVQSALLAVETVQGVNPVPASDQAGLGPGVTGATGDAASVASAVDSVGIVGASPPKKQA